MSYIMNTVTTKKINIISARGEYLTDSGGEKYLDWFADVGTVNLGYSPIGLMNSISHIPQHIPNTLVNPKKEKIAEILCRMTHMDKAFFCNSGSEAVEAAIKIVRKYNHIRETKRKTIYTYKGGFHGRTYGAISAGDGAPYHYSGFHPHLGGFEHFSKLLEINWDDAQAIMMATMFGNNDAIVYSMDFMKELHYRCDIYKVPIIFDEVQVGAGRTGTFNAFDYYGVVPDVLCLGKGIGSGIPTGVTLAKGDFAEIFTPGSHYSTFGGSPLSIAGIEYLLSEYGDNLQKSIEYNGEYIKANLKSMENISNVRGKGLWIAFDVADEKAIELSDEMLRNRMFVPTFRKNAIKITPMLNTQTMDEGLSKIRQSIKSIFGTV